MTDITTSALKSLINLGEIERLATPSNYRYGKAIFEGSAVKFIAFNAQNAQAWVGGLEGTVVEGGSQRRRTQLHATSDGLNWSCTCNSKKHRLFCKHCVALALAVLATPHEPKDNNDLLLVECEVAIAAPVQRVWQALTRSDQLFEWYAAGCKWEISDLAVGALIRFYNTETDVLEATISEYDPQKSLALNWHLESSKPTHVLINRFILSAIDSGTHVKISQSGYEHLPESIRKESFHQDKLAFAAIADSLRKYCEDAQ